MKKITAVIATVSLMAGASFSAQAVEVSGVGVGVGAGANVNTGNLGDNNAGARIGASTNLSTSAERNSNGQGAAERERGLVRAGERASDNAHLPEAATSGYGAAHADSNSDDKASTRARAMASVRGLPESGHMRGSMHDKAPKVDADARASIKGERKAK